jgi:nuclear pore complex protein Nup205
MLLNISHNWKKMHMYKCLFQLELLQTLDLSKEIELLQQNRALGGPRHHRQVEDLFLGIRQTLADVVYFWAAQCGLPKDPTFKYVGLRLNACYEIQNVLSVSL